MRSRGRISAAAQAITLFRTTRERPDPPQDLTDEQSAEWRAIVNQMERDWFPRETHALLTQYCRLIVRGRKVAQLINRLQENENLDLKLYRDLLRTEGEISQGIAHLATKMRLSQQSTYDRTKRKPTLTLEKPWENR